MRPFYGHFRARDLSPNLQSSLHFLTVCKRGKAMLSQAEVLGNRLISGKETPGMTWRFEPLHGLFLLVDRLV
jgi:hypothetical protein